MVAANKNRSLFGGGGKGDAEEEVRREKRSDRDLGVELDAIEKDLDELRAAYELYFMGVEKLEPASQRDLVKARLRRLQERKPKNTALRFRLQQLKARMVSLENYWQRTLRQREAGTYHRDLARMKRRAQPAVTERPAEVPTADRSEPRTEPPPRPALPARPSAPTRPVARSAEDLTDPTLRRLYDTYMGARKRCGESTDLRFEDMATTLRRQVPKLIEKTGAREVEFKVVIKGGKAVLKALPKT